MRETIKILIFRLKGMVISVYSEKNRFLPGLSQSQSLLFQFISQDLKMLKASKSLSSFQKMASTTIIKPKISMQKYADSQAQLLLQSRIEDQNTCILGLQSQKSKISNKASNSTIQLSQNKVEGTTSMPLSQLILRDNGYDYLFYEKKEQKLQQKYLQNLKEQKKQIQQMIDIICFQIIIAESTEIKNKINVLEKEILRLRAQRKSKSPMQQYSQYLGMFQNGRKQRLSGRFVQLPYAEKSTMKTHCDSKTPSIPSAPVSPVSRCKLLLSPQQVRSPNNNHHAKHITILKQKMKIIQNSIQTISSFNKKYIQQLTQENNLYRKQISLLNPLLRQSSHRKGNLRSTVGHYKSSVSSRRNRNNQRFQQNCSPSQNSYSRKSQMMRLIERTRKQFAQSPRIEYYRSGDRN